MTVVGAVHDMQLKSMVCGAVVKNYRCFQYELFGYSTSKTIVDSKISARVIIVTEIYETLR